ncbi:MAG: exosortase/archaeosortase family protein [Thermoplasmata archaeon]
MDRKEKESKGINKYRKSRLGLLVLGLVFLFSGLNIMLLVNKLKPWVGGLFFIIGLGIVIYVTRPDILEKIFGARLGEKREEKAEEEKEIKEKDIRTDIEDKEVKKERRKITFVEKVVDKITLSGKAWFIFPIIGISLILIDFYFNLKVVGETEWGSFDYTVTLLGLVLLVYHFIPKKYTREKNFMLTFLSLLCFIIILPIIGSFALTERSLGSSVEWYTSELLAKPLAEFVTLLGIPTTAYGEMITFTDINGHTNSLVISLGCSGIYSTMIFVSAFFGYVLTEYQRINFRVAILLLVGIVTAYVANILRMTIIVLVGYYYGMQALIWTHAHAGEIIFICWIAFFWYFMFKYLKPDEEEIENSDKNEGNKKENEAEDIEEIIEDPSQSEIQGTQDNELFYKKSKKKELKENLHDVKLDDKIKRKKIKSGTKEELSPET